MLAWQFVIIQVSEHERVLDPVLACARDQTVSFFQVICTSEDDIRFSLLQKTEFPYKILSICVSKRWFIPSVKLEIFVCFQLYFLRSG